MHSKIRLIFILAESLSGFYMHTENLSVSLPIPFAHFIEDYEALKLLQQKELEQYYREATSEIDPLFEITAADGLDDEMRD